MEDFQLALQAHALAFELRDARLLARELLFATMRGLLFLFERVRLDAKFSSQTLHRLAQAVAAIRLLLLLRHQLLQTPNLFLQRLDVAPTRLEILCSKCRISFAKCQKYAPSQRASRSTASCMRLSAVSN